MKKVTCKNCAPYADCISDIYNTQVENVNDLDVVMSMYNLTEYSKNYLKKPGRLRQYDRDEANNNIKDSASFKLKAKIIEKSPFDGNIKDTEIAMPLKYLSSF